MAPRDEDRRDSSAVPRWDPRCGVPGRRNRCSPRDQGSAGASVSPRDRCFSRVTSFRRRGSKRPRPVDRAAGQSPGGSKRDPSSKRRTREPGRSRSVAGAASWESPLDAPKDFGRSSGFPRTSRSMPRNGLHRDLDRTNDPTARPRGGADVAQATAPEPSPEQCYVPHRVSIDLAIEADLSPRSRPTRQRGTLNLCRRRVLDRNRRQPNVNLSC